jgi:hypothetical protein
MASNSNRNGNGNFALSGTTAISRIAGTGHGGSETPVEDRCISDPDYRRTLGGHVVNTSLAVPNSTMLSLIGTSPVILPKFHLHNF